MIRTLSGRAQRAQLDGYLSRIVDREFAEQGHSVRRPELLRRWMSAYAAATSTTASFETIRDAATYPVFHPGGDRADRGFAPGIVDEIRVFMVILKYKRV